MGNSIKNENDNVNKARELTSKLNKSDPNTALQKDESTSNLPKDYSSKDKALIHESRYQNVQLRDKFIGAVADAIKDRKNLRKYLPWVYVIYLFAVTALIFWILMGKYSILLKESLIGAFFLNLLSVFIMMIKYSFISIQTIVKLFRSLKKE